MTSINVNAERKDGQPLDSSETLAFKKGIARGLKSKKKCYNVEIC